MIDCNKLLYMYRILDSMVDDSSVPFELSADVLDAHDSIERVLLKLLLDSSISFSSSDSVPPTCSI